MTKPNKLDLPGLIKAKEALMDTGRPGAAAVIDELIRKVPAEKPARPLEPQ